MAATPLLGIPLPVSSGTDQVPTDMATALDAVEKNLVQIFASSSARTAAFTAAGYSPSQGMLSYLISPGQFQVYNGSAWVVDKNLSKAGGQGGMVGTYAGQPLIYESGAIAVTTGSGGVFTFNFATAFPTGLLSCVVSGGNTGVIAIAAAFGSSTLSTYSGIMYGTTVTSGALTPVGAGTANIVYAAAGW